MLKELTVNVGISCDLLLLEGGGFGGVGGGRDQTHCGLTNGITALGFYVED